jgi:hypothetical protein
VAAARSTQSAALPGTRIGQSSVLITGILRALCTLPMRLGEKDYDLATATLIENWLDETERGA